MSPMSLPLSGRRVLVTGASGFLGTHLVRALAGAGAQVVALSRRGGPSEAMAARADITSAAEVRAALKSASPEIVFHLAAYGVQPDQRDAEEATAVNVNGAVAVVDAAAESGARLFVQVGTSHEYGGSDQPLREDAPLNPVGIYGASKAAGTAASRARARRRGLRWLGLRPFVFYGPGEGAQKLVPYVITRGLCGEPVETSAGEQVRDFTYVEDMAAGIAAAALADLPDGEVLNLGSGEGLAITDVLAKLAVLIPGLDLRLGARLPRPDDVARQVADTRKQRRLLPHWRPKVFIDDGLKRTVAWYRGSRDRHAQNI